MLVEHVRGVLSRYISNRFSANGQIRTLVMSHDMESLVRGGIRQTSAGAFINLTPPETGSIIQSLESCIRSNGVNA
jgi:type III secretion protein V